MKTRINEQNVLEVTPKIFFLDKSDIQKKYAHLTFEFTDRLIDAWSACSGRNNLIDANNIDANNNVNNTKSEEAQAKLAKLAKAANAIAGILTRKAKKKIIQVIK